MYLNRRQALKLTGLGIATSGYRFQAYDDTLTNIKKRPMYGHSLTNRLFLPDSRAPTGDVSLKWEFEAEDWVISSPVIADDRLYVGSFDGSLYCLDPENGEKIWEYESGHRIGTVPCVTEQKVYFGNHSGQVFCLSREDGKKVWSYEADGWIRSSPTYFDGSVYCANYRMLPLPDEYDKRLSEEYDGEVFALDSDSGSLKWRTKVDDYFYSSPAFADGRLYIGGLYNGSLYAVDLQNGHVVWEHRGGGQISASPSIVGNNLYIGTRFGLRCVDVESGNSVWKAESDEISGVLTTSAVSEDTVYFSDIDGGVYAYDRFDGSQKWRVDTNSSVYSGGLVLAGGVLLTHNYRGELRSLDPKTGEEIWKHCIDMGIRPICEVEDGVIYLGSHMDHSGSIYALESSRMDTGEDSKEKQCEDTDISITDWSQRDWRTNTTQAPNQTDIVQKSNEETTERNPVRESHASKKHMQQINDPQDTMLNELGRVVSLLRRMF